MNKILRTKSSNNRIGGLLMILTLGVLMMTANSAITAQTFKNELIGTWRGADSSRAMATFTADEVTFYYDLADLDEGRGPALEEKKFKYTHLSNNKIELTSDGKISQTKITLEGEVLTVINDKGVKVRYMRDLQGTWVLVDDPKVKIVFTASEVAFKSLGVNGIYTRLSNNVIRVEANREVLLVQFTFEGEVLKMTVAQGSTKYKRESTNAPNNNANANTTAETAPIDYQKFKEIRLSPYSDGVRSVAFSPDGKTLAIGSGDSTVWLWNVADEKVLSTLSGHSSVVISVAFSPDGKTLASSSRDRTVKLWNVADGKELRTLSGYSKSVNSVAFSPDGKTLASGDADSTVKLWSVADGKELRTFWGHSQSVNSVAFSPDGKTLASGSWDNAVKLWNVADGKELRTLAGHSEDHVFSVAFSPDGKTLASGNYDKTVKLWNVADGKELRTLSGHLGSVKVAFSPDGKTLASGNYDSTVKLWNVADGKELSTLSGHSKSVNSVAFSPDGKTLASGSGDNTVKLWRVE